MIFSHQSSMFEVTLLKFSFKLHQIFDFCTRMRTPILVLHHHLGCHCPPNSTGTPPTHLLALCHPHQPPPSQISMVSPVKTGTLSKIFRNFSTFLTFSALGLHPPHLHPPPTLPGLQPHLRTLPRTSALPLRTFCAPSMHPCTLCAPSSRFVTLI